MRALTGFNDAKVMTGESSQLPKGGYVVKIMDCKEIAGEKNGNHYSYLAFSFDVAEGEYKNHYTHAYAKSTDENKKWKGTYNHFIPQEGALYYEENLSKFKTMTANFEESNEGYHWDWDEKKLKGKLIGVVYAEKEFKTTDGEVIVITEPRFFTSVERIKNGSFKIPNIKRLPNSSPAPSVFDEFVPTADEKLPWE